MMFMRHRSHLRFCALVASLGLACGSIALHAQDDNNYRGRKYKAPPPSARIEVTVLRDSSGKPIQDAHVIFHPVEGDKDKGSMELKTNEDGKIVIDVIPIGDTVRLQIIANGFQTYRRGLQGRQAGDVNGDPDEAARSTIFHLQEHRHERGFRQWLGRGTSLLTLRVPLRPLPAPDPPTPTASPALNLSPSPSELQQV